MRVFVQTGARHLVGVVLLGLILSPVCPGAEPVAVLRSAGITRMLQDVDTLSAETERPEIARFVRSVLLIANDLQGFDRERPLLLEVTWPAAGQKDPGLRLVLPTHDAELVRQTVGRLGLEFYQDNAGRERVRKREEGQGKHPYVKFLDNVVLVTQQPELLDNPLTDTTSLPGNDLSLTLFTQRIPDPLKAEALRKIQADIEKDLARQAHESTEEHAFRTRLMRLIEWLVTRGIEDTETLQATLDWAQDDSTANKYAAIARVHWQTRVDSPLDAVLPGAELSQHQFQLDPAAPLAVHLTAALPAVLEELLQEGLTIAESAAEPEISKAAPQHQELVTHLFEALDETFASRHAESLLQILPATEEHLMLLAAVAVQQGDSLDRAMAVILPEAERSSAVADVKLNVAEINQVRFHLVRSAHPRAAEEVLYGPQPAMYVGATEKAVWLAMGGDATLEHLPEYVGQRAHPATNPHSLLEAQIRLQPWLPFLERSGRTGGHAVAVRDVLQEAQEDRIQFQLQTTPRGLQAELTLDRPYLNLVAAGVTGRLKKR